MKYLNKLFIIKSQEKIRRLLYDRKEHSTITQGKQSNSKDLADKLFVTPQAVSRWENEEVEPSISVISEMAKIFNVPRDRILGIEGFSTVPTPTPTPEPTPAPISQPEQYVPVQPKPVLGICETCNKPIYDAEEIVRKDSRGGNHVFCRKCEELRLERVKKEQIANSRKRRIHSFVWGGLACVILVVIGIVTSAQNIDFSNLWAYILSGVAAFTLISCWILNNNFVWDMTSTIFRWGFVSLPGLIFELSLDGIIWLLTVKLLLWILGIILATITGILAIIIGGIVSLVVYPFALTKSINRPEETED